MVGGFAQPAGRGAVAMVPWRFLVLSVDWIYQ